MGKRVIFFILIALVVIVIILLLIILWSKRTRPSISNQIKTISLIASPTTTQNPETQKSEIVARFENIKPTEWSETAKGVVSAFQTDKKQIALTFDACGGSGGSGYDEKLIEYLKSENIPATLFINSRWIDANPETFKSLAANPLFEIENHGTLHIPCSVSGQSTYDIVGTKNASEAYDEIENNTLKITRLTGRKPLFYRAGTAFTDDVCPQIAAALGEKVVNYTITGDAGATYSAEQVKTAISKAEPGAIILMHMNHPEKDTAEGVISIIPELVSQGFEFVKLQDVLQN